MFRVGSNSVSATSAQFNLPVEPELEWTKSNMRRFAQLALKRARLKATNEDNAEFQKLQKARRDQFPNSPDQILSEWRQDRLRRELLAVLERNVELLQPEDQTRLRSLRNP